MTKSPDKKKKAAIVFNKKSPYMVSDLDIFTNSKGEKLKTTPVMTLCRCGLSERKPCCDGSHGPDGIQGDKLPGRAKDKLRSFKGEEITIHDNRGVCSHDRSCVNELPSVFTKGRRPWINPNGASVKDIVEAIEKCPSGALSYTIGHETCNCLDRPPAIKVAHNGPLEITGHIALKDDMGSTPQSPEHYTLCRCGGSKNKPFCDGTHHDNGFNDDRN